MPLHRTTKGDDPRSALAHLIRRIERGGATVVQVIDTPTEWLVIATHQTGHDDWETRTT